MYSADFEYDRLECLQQAIKLCLHKAMSSVECDHTFLEMVASKRRNHLKPGNLETLFFLSALKVPVKANSCYESEIKYLEA